MGGLVVGLTPCPSDEETVGDLVWEGGWVGGWVGGWMNGLVCVLLYPRDSPTYPTPSLL